MLQIDWPIVVNQENASAQQILDLVVSENRGTPSHHPNFYCIFPYKTTILGIPILETPIWLLVYLLFPSGGPNP